MADNSVPERHPAAAVAVDSPSWPPKNFSGRGGAAG